MSMAICSDASSPVRKNSCSSQLLVITQSKPVMFLEDYLEAEGYENLKYRLLCLEDEEAYSRTVAALMGTIMVNPVGGYDRRHATLSELHGDDGCGVGQDSVDSGV